MVKVGEYLGRVHAKNKTEADEIAHCPQHGVGRNVELNIEFLYSDPPYRVYEVTVEKINPIKYTKGYKGRK